MFDEVAGGEFDSLAVIVNEVWSTSEFYGGVVVTDGKSDFLGEKAGVWGDDSGANDDVVAVGKEFDKAVVFVVDFTGGNFAEVYLGFLVFAVATEEVFFIKTNGGNLEIGISGSDDALVVNNVFGVFNLISSEGDALLVSRLGRRFAADTIANGVNMFGGSFKIFINDNAGVLVFDFSVFKADIKIRSATGSKGDLFGADHFLGSAMTEDDEFTVFIFADSDDFAIS